MQRSKEEASLIFDEVPKSVTKELKRQKMNASELSTPLLRRGGGRE
jgi:hypothetical protein